MTALKKFMAKKRGSGPFFVPVSACFCGEFGYGAGKSKPSSSIISHPDGLKMRLVEFVKMSNSLAISHFYELNQTPFYLRQDG